MLINIIIGWAFIAVIVLFGFVVWNLILRLNPELRDYIKSDEER